MVFAEFCTCSLVRWCYIPGEFSCRIRCPRFGTSVRTCQKKQPEHVVYLTAVNTLSGIPFTSLLSLLITLHSNTSVLLVDDDDDNKDNIIKTNYKKKVVMMIFKLLIILRDSLCSHHSKSLQSSSARIYKRIIGYTIHNSHAHHSTTIHNTGHKISGYMFAFPHLSLGT